MTVLPTTKRAWGIVLLVGATLLSVLAAGWLVPQVGLVERFTRPAAPAARPNHIVARLENGETLVMPYESLAPTPPAAGRCEFDPLLPPANRRDGRYHLVDSAGVRLPDAGAYLEVASQAAAAGRTRDSEVALIMACRLSTGAGLPGPDVADVQQRLATLYQRQARSARNHWSAAVFRERSQYLMERSQAGDGAVWKPRELAPCRADDLSCS